MIAWAHYYYIKPHFGKWPIGGKGDRPSAPTVLYIITIKIAQSGPKVSIAVELRAPK